jgi:hypothetical protein
MAALDLPPQLQPRHCQAYFPTRMMELLVWCRHIAAEHVFIVYPF